MFAAARSNPGVPNAIFSRAFAEVWAAQELCTGLRQYMKAHHVQTGVGHYGVFSGRRWNNEVYPKVRDIIQMTD